jgi:hypothetical protein
MSRGFRFQLLHISMFVIKYRFNATTAMKMFYRFNMRFDKLLLSADVRTSILSVYLICTNAVMRYVCTIGPLARLK